MISEIRLPHLGENIESGQVVRVLVSVGEQISKEQYLLEVETEKASIEIPAETTGVVKEVVAKEGDTISIGDVILTIEEDSEHSAPKQPAAKPNEQEIPIKNTDSKEPSPKKVHSDPEIGDEQMGNSKIIENTHPVSPKSIAIAIPAAPSARRFARELGIEITHVKGSGPAGRISIDDIKAFSRESNRDIGNFPDPVAALNRGLPNFEKWGNVEVKPVSNIRSKIADNLSYAWSVIPHVTQFDKADITDLENQRKRLSGEIESKGYKLTVTAILLKVVATSLKKFPQFNASFDQSKKSMIYKNYYHIGVAVDTERGLLVPVIRDVNKKSILELCGDLATIADKARRRKLAIEDMQGGTFTISNLGGIGGSGFTPIINWPEVAILGVARSSFEPIFKDHQWVPRQMVPLSLSYDHRVIDGADGVRFLRFIIFSLENTLGLSL